MLLQSELTFGLLASRVLASMPAAPAIDAQKSPDTTVCVVVQSCPTTPKQRTCTGVGRQHQARAQKPVNVRTSPTWRLSQAASTVFWFTKATWYLEPDERSETATGNLETHYGMD